MKHLLLLSAATFAIGAQGPSFAQEGESGESEDRPMALSKVTVTAQRETQDLQDAAVAVTALPANELQDRGIQDVRDLSRIVPSLQFGTQINGGDGVSSTVYLRGMGQSRSGNGSEPSVPIYIDDFYYPSLAGNVLRALDLEQVEVLRGPQGTLFGRNSVGGAIRYESRKPDQDLGGFLEGTLGSYDRQDLIGAVNVPIGDMVSVRLTGATLETGGFMDSVNGGDKGAATENTLFRAQVRFTPTDDLTIDLTHQAADNDAFGLATRNDFITDTAQLAAFWNANPANMPRYDASLVNDCFYCNYGDLPVPDYGFARTHNTGASVAWEATDDLELKLMVGRTIVKDGWSNDVDGTPALVARQFTDTKVQGDSVELQALGNLASWFHYVAGFYYYDEETLAGGGQELTHPVLGTIRQESENFRDRKSVSGFGNVRLDLSEDLSATLGVRLANEKASISAGPASDEFDEDVVLPLAKLQYSWTDDIMTYVSYAKGYRAGGYNIVNATGEVIPFNSEDVQSYEVGARMEFFEGRVRFNPTAFITKWDDMQINGLFQPAAGAPTSILRNSGESTISGAELESTFVITEGLAVNFNASYLEPEYDSLAPDATITLDAPFANTPELFYAVGARYSRDIAPDLEFAANLDWSWRSDQEATSDLSDSVTLESYGLLNGQIELTSLDKGWNVSVFGTNLFDEDYLVSGLDLTRVVGNVRHTVGRPREFGIRLRKDF